MMGFGIWVCFVFGNVSFPSYILIISQQVFYKWDNGSEKVTQPES